MELWKEIEGFENYQVSSWGRVRSANATRGITLQKACMTIEKKYGTKFLFTTPQKSAELIVRLLSGEKI